VAEAVVRGEDTVTLVQAEAVATEVVVEQEWDLAEVQVEALVEVQEEVTAVQEAVTTEARECHLHHQDQGVDIMAADMAVPVAVVFGPASLLF